MLVIFALAIGILDVIWSWLSVERQTTTGQAEMQIHAARR